MSKIETLNRIFVNADKACQKGAFSLVDARQVMNDIEDLSNFIQAAETASTRVEQEPQAQTMGEGWMEPEGENIVAGTGDKVAKRRRS
jgi:hypothetical protein